MTATLTRVQFARATEIANAADEGGTVQAASMVAMFPGEPTKHTTSTLRDAWAMADELDGLDGDDIAEALWA